MSRARAIEWPALLLLSMLLTPLSTGCLITDPFDIPEEENFPPSIVSDLAAPEPRHPIESIVTLDRSIDTSLTFAVKVRDPNLEQELQYRVDLNYDPTEGVMFVLEAGSIEKTSELERPLTFTVNNLDLFERGTCHKVELLVTSDFGAGREPAEPGDLDIAVWWVNSLAEDGTPTDLDSCPD